MNLNRIFIGGNIVRDPELKFSQSGAGICKLTLANNTKYKTKDGAAKEDVTYVDVTAFGKTAESISKFFKRGSAILIEGRLKTESWEDKNTKEKRSKLVIVADGFQFCGRGEAKAEQAEAPATAPKVEASSGDSEIPF